MDVRNDEDYYIRLARPAGGAATTTLLRTNVGQVLNLPVDAYGRLK